MCTSHVWKGQGPKVVNFLKSKCTYSAIQKRKKEKKKHLCPNWWGISLSTDTTGDWSWVCWIGKKNPSGYIETVQEMYEGFSNNCEPNKCEHLMTKFSVGVGLHQGLVAWAFSFFRFVYEPLFFCFVYGQHYIWQPDEIPWYM